MWEGLLIATSRCEVFEEPPEEYWLEKEECPEYEPASLRGDE